MKNMLSNDALDTVGHFLNEGWPIFVSAKDAKELRSIKFLKVTKDKTYPDRPYKVELISDIPDKYVAEYWKNRYTTLSNEYENMWKELKEVVEKY